jgi:hypothetical protein
MRFFTTIKREDLAWEVEQVQDVQDVQKVFVYLKLFFQGVMTVANKKPRKIPGFNILASIIILCYSHSAPSELH